MVRVTTTVRPPVRGGDAARAPGTGGITLVPLADGFNDFWVRDTGCVFVRDTTNGNALNAIGFNFNGWGNANTDGTGQSAGTIPPALLAASNRSKAGKFFQAFSQDSRVAGWMAQTKGANLIRSTLTLEGGAIEFDGDGTAILTESSVLHVNRNPQLFDIPNGVLANATLRPTARDTVLAELQRTLGVRKIIWLPGTATFPRGSGVGRGHRASVNTADAWNARASATPRAATIWPRKRPETRSRATAKRRNGAEKRREKWISALSRENRSDASSSWYPA